MDGPGGLSAAAERAGIPQPTATRWLAEVTTALGTEIAVRSGRSLELTRAGTLLVHAAETAITQFTATARAATAEADPQRGSVALGFLHTVGPNTVPELLRGFRDRSPRVGFLLTESHHEELLDRLRSGALDVVVTSPLPDRSDEDDSEFHAAALYTQPIRAVLPKNHLLAGASHIRLGQLGSEQFITVKPGYGLRRMTEALFASAGLDPEITFESEEVETARGLVAAGLGIALLPARVTGTGEGTAELVLVPAVDRTIGLVWSASRPLPPSAEAFLTYAINKSWTTSQQR
jgi:DNA-binding transcriptional LysR family regulator